ncbi:MAG: plasmid mobilization protein [Desulfovibrio piger]|uniref:plasmid mobilization protein n=1 Tax=Desulfovibrio piger TaxID=901 RepID=UPI00399ADFF4
MKAKDKTLARFQCRRTLRLTGEEDARLSGQAAIAGISVSEYMRRLFFGGRPLVAKTDGQTIRELRRLGGLLKYKFEAVREKGGRNELAELSATLNAIRAVIERLSER